MPEWRSISGFNWEYQVSEDGQIRRKTLTYRNKFNPIVLVKTHPNGYKYCWLGGRNGRNFWIHRLVAFAFIGPQVSDLHEVAHWDGDKSNNHYLNLRWATRAENNFDKRRQDAHPKLTVAKVSDIRAKLPFQTRTSIAKEYGVTANMISRIALGRAWT